MFTKSEKLPVEVGDRVAVINDEKIVKGRVVEVVEGIAVFVTLAKGGSAIAYDRKDVMLLYRPVEVPEGKGVIPFVMIAPNKIL